MQYVTVRPVHRATAYVLLSDSWFWAVYELVSVLFWAITNLDDSKSLGLTCWSNYHLSLRSIWDSALLSRTVPIPARRALADWVELHSPPSPIIREAVSDMEWTLFHKRAQAVRLATVDLHRLSRVGLPGLFQFGHVVLPNITLLDVSLSHHSVVLLPRFLGPNIWHLKITLLEYPYPTSVAMLDSLATVTLVNQLTITFRDMWRRLVDLAESVDMPWVDEFLGRILLNDSLTEFRLQGCVVSAASQVLLSTLSHLSVLEISTQEAPHSITSGATEMQRLLESFVGTRLVRAWLHVSVSRHALDIRAVTRFINLRTLVLTVAGTVEPHHLSSLQDLSELQAVSIYAPGLRQALTPTLFRVLINGWPRLRTMSIASPPQLALTRPSLHIRDLSILAKHPDISWLLLPVDTECNEPLPASEGTACANLVLSLKYSGLQLASSGYVEEFLRHLCPTLGLFTPGSADAPWLKITRYYQYQFYEQLCRRMGM